MARYVRTAWATAWVVMLSVGLVGCRWVMPFAEGDPLSSDGGALEASSGDGLAGDGLAGDGLPGDGLAVDGARVDVGPGADGPPLVEGGTTDGALPVDGLVGDATVDAGPPVPVYDWSRTFGDKNKDLGFGVAVDPVTGRVYLAGTFRLSVDLGASPLGSSGGSDIFVAAFSAAGVLQWANHYGAAGDDTAGGIAVGPAGEVIVTGSTRGNVYFGNGYMVDNPGGGQGDDDIFLLSLDANGDTQWAKGFGYGPVSPDSGAAVAVDALGNIYLTGRISGPVSFGAGSVAHDTGYDIFVASFQKSGLPRWAKGYGSFSAESGQDIVVDKDKVFLIGNVGTEPIDLGKGKLTPKGGGDAFVAGYLAYDGQPAWAGLIGGPGVDRGHGVAVEPSGEVLVTGSFSAGVKDPGGGAAWTSQGGTDIFVARYGSDGKFVWASRAGGPSDDVGQALACDGAGEIYFAGTIRATVDLGDGPRTSAGGPDVVVGRATATGAVRWVAQLGGSGDDGVHDLALGPKGEVVFAGFFSDKVDFFGAGVEVSAGEEDGFVVSLDQQAP